MKQLVCDIDGWITNECEDFDYVNRTPREDRIKFLQTLAAINDDLRIDLETYRMKRDWQITEEWLRKNNVPYDSMNLLGPFGVKTHRVHDDANLVRYICNESKFAVRVDFATNALLRATIGAAACAGRVEGNHADLNISVQGDIPYDLSAFLTYLLHDEKVQKYINVAVKTCDSTFPDELGDDYIESIALVSGGVDSLITQQLTGSYPIFINYNETYNEREWAVAKELGAMRFDVLLPVRHASWQYVVPARNFIFVAIAAMFTNNIYLAAVKGDRSPDKNGYFFSTASCILSEYYGRDIKVSSPYGHLTKTELVAKYLEEGGNPDLLHKAISCYTTVGTKVIRHCGICKACVRRAIAYKLNDVYVADDYASDPFRSMAAKQMLKDAHNGVYEEERVDEILQALGG